MFAKCRNLVAAAIGASIFAGCGGECEHPEKVYESLPSACVSEEVDADLWLLPYKRYGFDTPNRYWVICSVKGESGPFDLLVSKWYGNGEYELMFGTSDAPARSAASNVLSPDDLEGVIALKCSVSIPEEWECKMFEVCEFDVCHFVTGCYMVRERYQIGVINAYLKYSEGCFDWYYNDPYIVRDYDR